MWKTSVKYIFLIFIVFLCGCTKKAAIDLGSELTYFVDESKSLTNEKVLSQLSNFKKPTTLPVEFPFSEYPYWLHTRIKKSQTSSPTILTVETEKLAKIEMYIPGREVQLAGNSTPMAKRALDHKGNVFIINYNELEELDVLFKVTAKSKIHFPLFAWSEKQFYQEAFWDYLILGLFLGTALIMAGYNLFLGLALKKTAYLYYTLYTFSLALYVAYDDRLLLQTFLKNGYTYLTSSIIYGLMPLTGILFFREFLRVRHYSKTLNKVLIFQIFISIALAFSGLFESQKYIFGKLLMLNILVALFLWAISTAIAIKNKYKPALYMAAALSVSVIFAAITSLGTLGVLNDFYWRVHGIKLAISLDLLIMSLGLADLYREIQRELYLARVTFLDEKDQLIREVHDSIGTQLHATILSMPKASLLKVNLSQILENVRDFSSIISSSKKNEISFQDSLNSFLKSLNELKQYQIEFTFDDRLNALKMADQLQYQRIFQEWVTNCLRHSNSTQFRIKFLVRNKIVSLKIQSNGSGFSWRSTSFAQNNIGTGLSNIQFRCNRLNAVARSVSIRGTDTLFVLRANKGKLA